MWYQQKLKGGNLSRSVCQEWWKTERKGFNRKAGKASMERQCHSQLTTHPCDLCGYDLFPLAPAATFSAACCQEVGQRPILVPIPLWPRRAPCTSEQKGRCDWQGLCWAGLGWAGCPGPSNDPSNSRDCSWQCPPLSACSRRISRELETQSVVKCLH